MRQCTWPIACSDVDQPVRPLAHSWKVASLSGSAAWPGAARTRSTRACPCTKSPGCSPCPPPRVRTPAAATRGSRARAARSAPRAATSCLAADAAGQRGERPSGAGPRSRCRCPASRFPRTRTCAPPRARPRPRVDELAVRERFEEGHEQRAAHVHVVRRSALHLAVGRRVLEHGADAALVVLEQRAVGQHGAEGVVERHEQHPPLVGRDALPSWPGAATRQAAPTSYSTSACSGTVASATCSLRSSTASASGACRRA